MGKTETKTEVMAISPPKFAYARFVIEGVAPLVLNKFSAKAREEMRLKHEAGSTSKKGAKKQPKDFMALFNGARHRAADGWDGIPAPAFRNAMVSACRMAGFKMTHAKLSVFVEPDGFDAEDNTPLVRITKGEPEYSESMVRNETGVVDIRPRPMWAPGWEAQVVIRYDADQFTITDVGNLLMRAGMQVGIGEGRPDSRRSAGMGWGLFKIRNEAKENGA